MPADSKEPVREWKSFYFNEAERKNIAEVAPFLLKDKRIKDLPKPDTVDDSLARQVFKEAGYTAGERQGHPGRDQGRAGKRLPLQGLIVPGSHPTSPGGERRLAGAPPDCDEATAPWTPRGDTLANDRLETFP